MRNLRREVRRIVREEVGVINEGVLTKDDVTYLLDNIDTVIKGLEMVKGDIKRGYDPYAKVGDRLSMYNKLSLDSERTGAVMQRYSSDVKKYILTLKGIASLMEMIARR